jgi:hypothetical protein
MYNIALFLNGKIGNYTLDAWGVNLQNVRILTSVKNGFSIGQKWLT